MGTFDTAEWKAIRQAELKSCKPQNMALLNSGGSSNGFGVWGDPMSSHRATRAPCFITRPPAASTISLTIYAGPGLSPPLSCLRAMLSRFLVPKARPQQGRRNSPEGRGVAFFEERKKCHTELPEI